MTSATLTLTPANRFGVQALIAPASSPKDMLTRCQFYKTTTGSCLCSDFVFRKMGSHDVCKHVKHVRNMVKALQELAYA